MNVQYPRRPSLDLGRSQMALPRLVRVTVLHYSVLLNSIFLFGRGQFHFFITFF